MFRIRRVSHSLLFSFLAPRLNVYSRSSMYVKLLPHETFGYVSIVGICARWDCGADMEGGSYPASQTPRQWRHESGDAFTGDYHEQRKFTCKRHNLAPCISQIRNLSLRMHPKCVPSAPHRLIVARTSQRATSQPPRSGASERGPSLSRSPFLFVIFRIIRLDG